jgi:predicted ABC-type ATPase
MILYGLVDWMPQLCHGCLHLYEQGSSSWGFKMITSAQIWGGRLFCHTCPTLDQLQMSWLYRYSLRYGPRGGHKIESGIWTRAQKCTNSSAWGFKMISSAQIWGGRLFRHTCPTLDQLQMSRLDRYSLRYGPRGGHKIESGIRTRAQKCTNSSAWGFKMISSAQIWGGRLFRHTCPTLDQLQMSWLYRYSLRYGPRGGHEIESGIRTRAQKCTHSSARGFKMISSAQIWGGWLFCHTCPTLDQLQMSRLDRYSLRYGPRGGHKIESGIRTRAQKCTNSSAWGFKMIT